MPKATYLESGWQLAHMASLATPAAWQSTHLYAEWLSAKYWAWFTADDPVVSVTVLTPSPLQSAEVVAADGEPGLEPAMGALSHAERKI
jgi:hypothetical protein